ncbi:MAG: ATP-dependent helicase [Caldilineaceae bacterium]|nr:ATP-dependent helicase [Caldilineaceae bacterium]
MTPQLFVSDDFLTAYARIPRNQQKKVREFLAKFRVDPTAASINYEPIHNVRDQRIRTVRIDQTYRAVILHPDTGDHYVLVWVDHHDRAMEWAANKIFPVNPVTGALQMLDMAQMAEVDARAPQQAAPADKAVEEYRLFETFSNEDLLRTGLPAPLLPSVRSLRRAEELDALEAYLPAEAFEALYWIANLGYSVKQALEAVGTQIPSKPVDPEDLSAALAHPDSQRRFHLVESDEELGDILDAPLEKWRIFLHPSQAQLVERHFNGPARVLGGAGTGKTVVAMHRARYLARNVFPAPNDRILFTTFTRNLATNIAQNLDNLCGAERARIEVTNLHAWATQFLRNQGIPVAIAEEDDIAQCWQNALYGTGNGDWPEALLRNEWNHVIQAQDISDRASYLRASRQGQGFALNRGQRAAMWPIFAAYREELTRIGKWEWVDVVRRARQLLEATGMRLPYRAIVVDETQDLDAGELRLLRAMIPEGPNDLFFVGDAHQRIYGRPVVMAHCGIHIRGRAARLRINYRTTEEIRRWAVSVLAGTTVDDLDGGVDSNAEYVSIMHGIQPTVRHFAQVEDELSFLELELHELITLTAPDRICIVARTHEQLQKIYIPALRRAAIDYLYLQATTPEYAGSGIRVATMHRVKGLEFEHVFLVGLSADVFPMRLSQMPDEGAARTANELQERCLLHVAATRARESLTVTSSGTPSPLLGDLQLSR